MSSPASQTLEGWELRLADARFGFSFFDLHAQIVPSRLAGDRIGIGIAVAALAFRKKIADQVIEQESFFGFRGVRGQSPGTRSLADRVPGPNRVGIDAIHELDLHLDAAVRGRDMNPVTVADAKL